MKNLILSGLILGTSKNPGGVLRGALLFVAGALQAAPEGLPKKTDIPEDFSMVRCANEQLTRSMLQTYYVRGREWFDSDTFFQGLKATGCEQVGGPVQIKVVLQRKVVYPGREGVYLAFQGVETSGSKPGKTVFGIVHEFGNNHHPRTDFERWLRTYAPDGFLKAKSMEQRTYVCPSVAAANKVIASIPEKLQKDRIDPKILQLGSMQLALREHRCTLAEGSYRVRAVHQSVFIDLGFEAGEDWTALTATDANGKEVGLLHDAFLM